MGRKQSYSEAGSRFFLIVLAMGGVSCLMVYMCLSVAFKPGITQPGPDPDVGRVQEGDAEREEEGEACCRGIDHLELWGDAVKWGANFKFNSSEECCRACRSMCGGDNVPCLCDSWVFCGNKETCGSNFGECWLKKQKDSLEPDRRDSGDHVIWTSGLIYGGRVGIVGLETEYGTLRIKLFPDCAPHSVSYILELLAAHHCSGCHLYRAEGRGSSWDAEGNHIEHASHGPPFGLLQGTLEAHGVMFKSIPNEVCPNVRRGSVAWVGHGPEIFISLANHLEWRNTYRVFGSIVAEDMVIAEKIAQQPALRDVWSNITVRVLKKHIPLRFRRVK